MAIATESPVKPGEFIEVSFTADEIAKFQRAEESAYWGDMTPPQYNDFMEWLKSKPKPELLNITVYQQDGDWFILDGYHRWKGTCELGITDMLTIKQYTGEDRAMLGMVLNANRRQLSSGKRAMLVQQLREQQGMTKQQASAAAKVSERQIQRAQNAEKAGLAAYVLDEQMTLEDAVDIGKQKSLLNAVKSGETPVSVAVQQVQNARHDKRRESENRRYGNYGLTGDDAIGERADRGDYEQLLKSSRTLMARNDVLSAEVKALEITRNEMMAEFSETVADLKNAGVPLSEVISRMEAESAANQQTVSPPPVNSSETPQASARAKKNGNVSDEVEAARQAAGYYDMTPAQKAAWTRIYGG